MKGRVTHINQPRGMAAVLTEGDGYSIIELSSGDEVEIGDVLSWRGDHPLGSETIRNVTQSQSVDVFFQNHCVNQSQLRQQLLY